LNAGLYQNEVSDISSLASLVAMEVLEVSDNNLSNIDAVSGMTNMRQLSLWGNSFSDLTPLQSLTELSWLFLSQNNISDLSHLSALVNLTELLLNDNQIVDVTPLTPMIKLQKLELENNLIKDITPLVPLGKTTVYELALLGNEIFCWQLEYFEYFITFSALTRSACDGAQRNGDYDQDGLLNFLESARVTDPYDTDTDDDGVLDGEDEMPKDPAESLDTDGDGIGNNADDDDDGDGVADSDDVFPLDATEWLDTDNDQIGNNSDEDDDNDGVSDGQDAFPLDANESIDTDGDGIGNNSDDDDDGDGVVDSEDGFPLDPDRIHKVLLADLVFTDAALERCVLAMAAEFDWVAVSQMTDLSCVAQNISSLAGIEELTELTKLSLTANPVVDLTLISELTQLSELNLSETAITSLDALAGLVNLTSITLQNNQLSNVALLAGLTELTAVALQDNQIDDISGLAQLSKLESVALDNNNITDIASLLEIDTLKTIRLGNNNSIGCADLDSLVVAKDGVNIARPDSCDGLTPNIEAMSFTDGNLLACVAENAAQNGWSTAAEVTALDCYDKGIHQLRGIEGFKNLTTLDVRRNRIKDVAPLVHLTDLSTLKISQNHIRSLLPLAQMHSMSLLSASSNAVEPNTLSALSGMSNLKKLYLRGNHLTDISPLAELTNLTHLYLRDNGLTNVDAVAKLVELKNLQLSNNALVNIAGLHNLSKAAGIDLRSNHHIACVDIANLITVIGEDIVRSPEACGGASPVIANLSFDDAALLACVQDTAAQNGWTQVDQMTTLACKEMAISNIKGLENLTALTKLDLRKNALFNMTQLNSLTQLVELKLSNNNIQNVAALSVMPGLRNLTISNNQLDSTALESLSRLTLLEVLYVRSNNISDVTPLGKLTSLTRLYLRDNSVVDTTPLAGLSSIATLQLSDNAIRNVSGLLSLTSAVKIDLSNNLDIDCTDLNNLDNTLGAGTVVRPEDCKRATDRLDTDGDGIEDGTDTDDDNDGVLDVDDAFPLDATESVDTDGDGIGDNSDLVPDNGNCAALSDYANGSCYVEQLGQQNASKVFKGSADTIYFYLESVNQILPYNTQTEHFETPVQLAGQDGQYPQTFVYSSTHQRTYLGYESGLVTYLDADSTDEQVFDQAGDSVSAFIAMGNRLLVNMGSATSRAYTAEGTFVEVPGYYYGLGSSRDMAWSEADNRLYFFRDGLSPNDLHYMQIDPNTAETLDSGETPYHGSYSIMPPIRVSPSGSHILLGSGDIYRSSDLNWVRSIGSGIDEGVWLDNGELVIFKSNDTVTSLLRYNADNIVAETYTFSGVIEKNITVGEIHFVVSRHQQVLSIEKYTPNDDTDNDGVSNLVDHFPQDPAASVDSDSDGYPDSWNDGQTEQDSTTGLTLDSYPSDTACYLEEHGDGVLCDYASTVPDFTPDQIQYDENGIVYLLHSASNRIYRWSNVQQSYINPLIIGFEDGSTLATPTIFEYSQSQRRIYLGYSSGAVRMINLGDNEKELAFVNLARQVGGLSQVGDYLLAQDSSGAWNAHYTFDQAGNNTDYKDWNRYSTHYAWDANSNKVYFFRNGTSPNDLHYEQIDQSNGVISAEGETPYHGDYSIRGPIRISLDGDRILLGSGDVYSASSMEIAGQLGESFTDGIWMDNIIVTASVNTSGSVLSVWDATTYQLKGHFNVAGYVEALIPNDGDITIVSVINDQLVYTVQLIADHDGDGIPGWWEALYDLNDDDATDAALDGDVDGLTNLQEFALGTDPTNSDTDNDGVADGLEANTYLTNPLDADSDGDGLSDGREVNELLTNPLSTDSDDDGLSDWDEVMIHATNPLSSDSDADGMSDSWEVANSTNPMVDDAQLDADADGLANIDEITHNTNPNVADTDGDGLSDGEEVNTYATNPVNADSDGDHMADGWEVTYSFDPLNGDDADTDFDQDTFSNLDEYFLNSDPTDATSLPVAQDWGSHQGNAAHNGFMPIDLAHESFSLRWSITMSESVELHPVVVADGSVFATSSSYRDNFLFAINSVDGSERWKKGYGDINSINPPAYANGYVYFQTGGHGDSFLRALNAVDGALQFKSSYSNQWSNYDAATPYGDDVYVAGGSYGGMYKFNGSGGEQSWFTDLAQVDHWTPAVDENNAYAFSNGLAKINKTDGTIVNHIAAEEFSWSGITPVLGFDQDLFAISSRTLVAYDLRTQAVKWQKEANYTGDPTIGLGQVFALNNSALVVLDEFDGNVLWSWEPDNGASLSGNIVVSKNLVFVHDNANTYAIDLKTHQQVWTYAAGGHLSLSNEGALYIATSTSELIAINVAGDSDADGMPDWWENHFGLDRNDATDAALDTDADGLTNLEEFGLTTDPTNNDSDGDTITDGDEVNTYQTNPLNVDSDDDGLSDAEEINTYGTDPLLVDSDGDGLTDQQEVRDYSTDPLNPDTDGDGLTDSWEITYSTDPVVDDAQLDSDADGLVNIEEFNHSTDPNVADTDGDGLNDGLEVNRYSTNPLVMDTDEDRMLDGWEVVNSLDPLSAADALTDLDSDGFANYEEFYLSTNPNDVNDFAQSQPWITFGANARHDGFVVQSVDSTSIAEMWRYELGANPHQVVAAQGKVFISNDSYFGAHQVRALNSASGADLWEISYDDIHSLNPPAYANGKVFFQTGGHSDSFLRGVNATTGAIEFASAYSNQWSNYQAPTPFEDDIYVSGGSQGGVYGFTQAGEQKFFNGLQGYDEWTPSVDSEFTYAYDGPALKVFDRHSGILEYTIEDANFDWNGWSTPGAGILGNENNFITVENRRLISFDLQNQTVGWEKSANYINEAALAYGRIYVISNGVLTVLDESSGDLLWSYEAPNGTSLVSNIVVTRNLLFVGTASNTYAIDLTTHLSVWNSETPGHLSLSEGVLYVAGNQQVVAFNVDGDDDEDGLPNWWENNHGLDPQDASDATQDTDVDGLTNLAEYTHGTNPLIADTDSDGLSDGAEVNTHSSNPLNSDSDADGLTDGDEVNTYNTDPMVVDSDGDGFGDGEEVNQYDTDPADAESAPQAITSLSESFESISVPLTWTTPDASDASWLITDGQANEGNQSLRSGDIDDSQESVVEFKTLFAAGTFSFDARVDSESCCDGLQIFVDGNSVVTITSGQWETYSFELDAGEHVIRFRYVKDSSASNGEDAAWIDNINFAQ
jgi:Leucine-rich repeat (LRR) protein